MKSDKYNAYITKKISFIDIFCVCLLNERCC